MLLLAWCGLTGCERPDARAGAEPASHEPAAILEPWDGLSLATLPARRTVSIDVYVPGCYASISYSFEIQGGDPLLVDARFFADYELHARGPVSRQAMARFDRKLDEHRAQSPYNGYDYVRVDIEWPSRDESFSGQADPLVFDPTEPGDDDPLPFDGLAELAGIRF